MEQKNYIACNFMACYRKHSTVLIVMTIGG